LIKDIFDGNLKEKERDVILELLDKINPIIENAERTFWDKVRNLIKWS
jgi:hypothetical protein